MHPSFLSRARRAFAVFAAACAVFAAGCHGNNNNNNSGYGVGWITLSSEAGPFTSYVVTIDSLTLTDKFGNTYTALSTAEPVDLVQVQNLSALWGSATIPNDTYVAATFTLDYTNAAVYMLVDGVQRKAKIVGPTGAAVNTVAVTVALDPATPFTIVPSYSTDNAQRVAINFNLPASSRVTYATVAGVTTPVVAVDPYATVSLAPADDKMIKIRGPLVNSAVALGTFTAYERPYYDEVNSLGTVSIFNSPSTVYTIDGFVYTGLPGLNYLSQKSAGVTETETWGYLEPTQTTTGYAGKFHSYYVVAGSSSQSTYTENVSGIVTARTGPQLTLTGATVYGEAVYFNSGYFNYLTLPATVILGPGTIVTADDNASLTNLTSDSIAVGQQIIAIGTYSTTSDGHTVINASSPTSGQVRLQQTQAFGRLVSAAPGSLVLDLQALNGWPASFFQFYGTAAENAATTANYKVDTGTLDLSATPAATALFPEGYAAPAAFGSSAPNFNAASVASQSQVPASLQAQWKTTGSIVPFIGFGASGFEINLADPALLSAELHIGAESIVFASPQTSPKVVPTTQPVSITTYPTFSPLFSFGNAVAGIAVYSAFSTYTSKLATVISSTHPVVQFEAGGYYDKATNVFTANSVNVVVL